MLGLIDNIYAAAQTPALWGGVLQQIQQAAQGESIALYAGAPGATAPALVAMQGDSLDAWPVFAEYYAAINPLYPACQSIFTSDDTWRSSAALPDAVFEKTEFYNDFFKPNKMFYSLGLRLELGDAPAASISIQRDRTIGDFSASADAALLILRPHLQRALMLYRQLGAMKTAALGLEAALDAHGHAVLGLDTNNKVVLCNPSATALLRAGDGLQLMHGNLGCTRQQDAHGLHAAIASVLAGGVGRAVMVHRANGTPLRIVVSPFRGKLPGHSSHLAVLLYISDAAQTTVSRAGILQDLYGLTPSEARIADLLAAGLDVRELAEKVHITYETARFNVKSILTKTGARKQSELIRLMLTLPAFK
jgi:DNA-binding CsgD family transcriptional regulator